MPIIGVGFTAHIYAEDVAAGGGKTGDAANITPHASLDGLTSPVAAPAVEVDAVNFPGLYSVVLTDGENTASNVVLGGVSSTADVVIRPTAWTNQVNIAAIKGDLTALNNFLIALLTERVATVDTSVFTSTTTEFETSDLNLGQDADNYVGRIVLFNSGQLAGQGATITASSDQAGKVRLTVTALTSAPANNDQFIIV